MEKLLRITAPHFCAGAVVKNERIIHAAPIIAYMVGRPLTWALEYCQRKRWIVDTCHSTQGTEGGTELEAR